MAPSWALPIEAAWQLDMLLGAANGLPTGAIGVTLAAVVANRWFVARRGLVVGMLTASNATGQLENTAEIGKVRKQIARINTLIRSKEIAAAEAGQ